jgi:two-component system, OmpR family, sensor histidine kinase CiaH
MQHLFSSATFKLTVWYLAIIMVLTVSFSVLIYNLSAQEIAREFPTQRSGAARFLPIDMQIIREIREHQAEESNARLRANLVLLNLATLGLAGGASYLLARRTLSPIRDMVTSQIRFTSDASHELRTPLTTMRTELEVALRHRRHSASELYELLESNLEDVVSLQGLTDRLLQLASGRSISMSHVSLEEVAITAVNRFILPAQAKDITIDNTIGDGTVRGNAEALVDVLGIIIDNAIKYSPNGSTVTLSSRQLAREIEVAITDQGQGIAADDLPHIFERFYRADTSRTKSTSAGFGLGLSIAKRLVELHEGTITARSTVGKGTTMLVRLPRVASRKTT